MVESSETGKSPSPVKSPVLKVNIVPRDDINLKSLSIIQSNNINTYYTTNTTRCKTPSMQFKNDKLRNLFLNGGSVYSYKAGKETTQMARLRNKAYKAS